MASRRLHSAFPPGFVIATANRLATRSDAVCFRHGAITAALPSPRPALTASRCFASTPSSSPSSPTTSSDPRLVPTASTTPPQKGFLARMWDEYSPDGQRKRIVLGERLFRAAQVRASDPSWYSLGRIPSDFRGRHAVLTMHVWFLHRRLLADGMDPHAALLIQEELFDILWNDSRARIRAEGVSELTVNKHLKDVQRVTFEQCTHYDHAYEEHADDARGRFEELKLAVWAHVLRRDEEFSEDHVRRIAAYVEYQYHNVAAELPDEYFWEGRIPWGDIPDFTNMVDKDGQPMEALEVAGISEEEVVGKDIPAPWVRTLTDAGESYYWNTESNDTKWEKPSLG